MIRKQFSIILEEEDEERKHYNQLHKDLEHAKRTIEKLQSTMYSKSKPQKKSSKKLTFVDDFEKKTKHSRKHQTRSVSKSGNKVDTHVSSSERRLIRPEVKKSAVDDVVAYYLSSVQVTPFLWDKPLQTTKSMPDLRKTIPERSVKRPPLGYASVANISSGYNPANIDYTKDGNQLYSSLQKSTSNSSKSPRRIFPAEDPVVTSSSTSHVISPEPLSDADLRLHHLVKASTALVKDSKHLNKIVKEKSRAVTFREMTSESELLPLPGVNLPSIKSEEEESEEVYNSLKQYYTAMSKLRHCYWQM